MQTLLQGLHDAPEIVASGPVVLNALHEKLKTLSPTEAMMVLQNLNFRVTRPAPNVRRRNGSFDFTNTRSVNRSKFV